MTQLPHSENWPIKSYVISGVLAIILLVAGLVTWLATANLSGAIIVPGQLARSQNNAEIQHLTGGAVKAVYVVEGQKVNTNDTLVRLDDSTARAEMAILGTQHQELVARRARLITQRDGLSAIQFPPEIVARGGTDASLNAAMAGQVRLFTTRQTSWFQEQEATKNKITQIAIQITGTDAQLDALNIQRALVAKQLDQQDLLFKKACQRPPKPFQSSCNWP